MDRTIRQTIGVVVVAAILGVAYYGSYLPLTKAQSYIATLQDFQSKPPTSLQDLEARLSPSLDAPSPIGQEELVRNAANSILGLVQRGVDASSTAGLISYLNSYYDPIISQGKGMSFGQDVYLEGAINEIAFAHTGDPTYLLAAKQNYLMGEALGPNRPQPLYGLFDVYRAMGDATDTTIIAQKILANWPTDVNIGPALQQFLGSVKSAKPSTAKSK